MTYKIKFLIDAYDTKLRVFKFFDLNFIPTANMFMVMQDGSKCWLDQDAEDNLVYMHRNNIFELRVRPTCDMSESFLISQGWRDINELDEDNIDVVNINRRNIFPDMDNLDSKSYF